ncbi:APC family permease [uncultured Cellulomonas sp.]|uniref:APC family permease n=1 Tax=uncultured Cellulomonas sp. TaxID=189682 RepID=UPI0026385872|nr:APC family permease [uncultured Cellulomonas sp.]
MPATDPAVPAPGLDRRLGLADAVVLGVGSMLGAGVFAVLAPAAASAGPALLVGLAIAAVVAYANAMSTAQLAAVMPTSGGAYRYGRERLGPWWGYAAGWCFVLGKTASCAAMAMTFAAYVLPDWQRPVAVAAVVVLVAVNERGITRTAGVTRVLVAVTTVVLAAVVVAGVAALDGPRTALAAGAGTDAGDASVLEVLRSAGLLFFAMAGYARIATLGGEVRDPRRTIPRAIGIALGAVLVVYALVAVVALAVVGPAGLATSTAPLVDVVTAAGRPELAPLVRVGAAAACLGALLGLVAGVGRTTFAMAQEGDLPRRLAAVHPRSRVPHLAERAVGVAVIALVLVADVRTLLGFSSFGVLLYYGVANAAALTQRGRERRWPRALHVVGLVGCLVLAVTLPPSGALAAAAVLAVGLLGRHLARRRASGRGDAAAS